MLIQTSVSGKNICPFMNKPFADCYCLRSGQFYIDNVLTLCGANYESCKIYLANATERTTANGPD